MRLKPCCRYQNQINTKKWTLRIGLGLLAILFLLLSFFWGGYYAKHNQKLDKLWRADQETTINFPAGTDFDLYWDTWQTLKENYVDSGQLNEKDFFYGSLKGMVAAIGDPYTIFLDPKENKQFQDDLSGSFEGIGAEIGLRKDIITVISPLDGTPAALAGIKAGDQIYAINGTSTAGMSVDQAVSLIRGKKGSTVKLTIYRSGASDTKDYNIVRDLIVVQSVKTEMRADGIYVIKVSAFNSDTQGLFNKAAQDILIKKPRGLILDLRNNPGGFLDAAVDMSSAWVDKETIVIEKFGDGRENKYQGQNRAKLKNINTMVLVNGGSASASEIVAGALKDNQKATIIGEKTFGKGSVQTLIDLSDGSAIKITVAKWLTPAGVSINEQGITPNIEIELSAEDANKNSDPQLDKALEILKKR